MPIATYILADEVNWEKLLPILVIVGLWMLGQLGSAMKTKASPPQGPPPPTPDRPRATGSIPADSQFASARAHR